MVSILIFLSCFFLFHPFHFNLQRFLLSTLYSYSGSLELILWWLHPYVCFGLQITRSWEQWSTLIVWLFMFTVNYGSLVNLIFSRDVVRDLLNNIFSLIATKIVTAINNKTSSFPFLQLISLHPPTQLLYSKAPHGTELLCWLNWRRKMVLRLTLACLPYFYLHYIIY